MQENLGHFHGFLWNIIFYFTSVREVFFGFAGHSEFFAGHLIEFNSSSSPDILKIRRTCPASPANFAYTDFTSRRRIVGKKKTNKPLAIFSGYPGLT